MSTTLISPGPTTPINQNEAYALPASSCDVLTGVLVQRSTVALTGPFTDWIGSNTGVVNVGGGWVKCVTGNTTIKATKTKMEFDKYGKKIMKDGASNYWRLNEVSGLVARDIVGGANGTISGGVTLNQAGATKDNDKAMTFDGTTGKIQTTAITIPVIATIEAWFRLGSVAVYQSLFSTRTVSTGSSLAITINPGNGKIEIYGKTPTSTLVSARSLLTNSLWHHLVLVTDGSVASLYLDGTADSVGIAFVRSTPSSGPGLLASDIDGSPLFWTGQIDEVAIYPYALSANQISAHYTAGKR